MTLKTGVHRLVNSVFRRGARFLRVKRLPMLFNGRWIRVTDRAWGSIRRVYEPAVANAMEKYLKEGGTFFDLGAHHGFWSLFAADVVGPQGKVLALEPSPAFKILEESLGKNSPVAPMKIGVGRIDGRATFFDQGDATSGSFVKEVTEINVPFAPEVPIGTSECSVRSLDSLVSQFGQVPDVIKMDIEGYEMEALLGARATLENKSTTWIVEIHPLQLERSGYGPNDVYQCFQEFGYEVEVIDSPLNQPQTILARAPSA